MGIKQMWQGLYPAKDELALCRPAACPSLKSRSAPFDDDGGYNGHQQTPLHPTSRCRVSVVGESLAGNDGDDEDLGAGGGRPVSGQGEGAARGFPGRGGY